MGTSLLYFHDNHLQELMKWAYAKRIIFYLFLNLHEFEGYGANKLMEKDHFEQILKHLKQQLEQRVSAVSSGVQQTVVGEATDKWRWHLRAAAKECHF